MFVKRSNPRARFVGTIRNFTGATNSETAIKRRKASSSNFSRESKIFSTICINFAHNFSEKSFDADKKRCLRTEVIKKSHFTIAFVGLEETHKRIYFARLLREKLEVFNCGFFTHDKFVYFIAEIRKSLRVSAGSSNCGAVGQVRDEKNRNREASGEAENFPMRFSETRNLAKW